MQVTMTFPDKLMRKLRALHALTGSEIDSFDEFLCDEISKTVDSRIIQSLDVDAPVHITRRVPAEVVMRFDPDYDVGVGLSSESIPEEEEAPKVSREMLEADMTVANPEIEALSPDNEEVSFADLIGSVSEEFDKTGVDLSQAEENPFQNLPVVEDDPPPRQNVRKLPKDFRGKITDVVNAGVASANTF